MLLSRRLPPSAATRRSETSGGLATLALGTFLCVTLANLPVGLLPQISESLDVSVPAAGLLVMGYAATATLSAVPLARATARRERRGLLVLVLADLCASNLVAGLAPGYAVLLGARLLGGLAHGLFWSIAAPIAGRLAGVDRQGRAISIMFLGNAAASIGGIPLATLLGQRAGWRSAFLAAALVAALVLVVALRALPRMPGRAHERGGGLRQLLRRRPVQLMTLAAFLAFTAQFAVYTYLTVIALDVAGLPSSAISPLLLAFGAMSVVGNIVAGRTVDRDAGRTAAAFVALLACVLAGLALLGAVVWVAVPLIAVWGAALAGLSVAVSTRVLEVAPDQREAVSALNVVACNAGIGGGTLLGGLLIGPLGGQALAGVGAAIALGGVAALLAAAER